MQTETCAYYINKYQILQTIGRLWLTDLEEKL
jgi:hypothetical protein